MLHCAMRSYFSSGILHNHFSHRHPNSSAGILLTGSDDYFGCSLTIWGLPPFSHLWPKFPKSKMPIIGLLQIHNYVAKPCITSPTLLKFREDNSIQCCPVCFNPSYLKVERGGLEMEAVARWNLGWWKAHRGLQ